MAEMADIFRACGQAYWVKYGKNMLPSHKRAMRDIVRCRTEALGGRCYYCQPCQESRYSYHSCCNRHCPKCKNDAASTWLAKQSEKLLPVPHFLVTVTMPHELHSLTYRQQKRVYGLLIREAAQAILKLGRDPKFIGGNIGIIAILHTWTRDLCYHPHVHFIVPGGGLSQDGQRWLPAHRDYLMPAKALSRIFRGKFRDALNKAELLDKVPKGVWRKDWVIDIRPVGKGKTALKYLAPYVFRVAISNRRIVNFCDGQVTFRYQKSGSKHWQAETLPAERFISRFLMHVLPYRFVKVRYYGFFSPRKRAVFELVKELFALFHSEENNTASGNCFAAEVRVMRCPKCGGQMVFVREIRPQKHLLNLSNQWRPP